MATSERTVDTGGTTAMIEILIIGAFVVLVVIFIIWLIHAAGAIRL
jgi:hypothetical protein